MDYREYKIRQEEKARKEITGPWKFFSWFICYRTKEFFAFLIILLFGWVLTLIFNPGVAEWIRHKIGIGGF